MSDDDFETDDEMDQDEQASPSRSPSGKKKS